MLIIFSFIVLIMLFSFRIHRHGLDEQYLSKFYTSSIKGIFVLLVFMKHAGDYVEITTAGDLFAMKPIYYLGQLIVAMFLFYSGYGVYESVKRKGTSYVNHFPTNRLLKTFIDFSFAVSLFYVLGEFIRNHHSLSQFFWSLTGWDSVGNSNWYMFAIFILYIFTYVGFKIFQKKKFLSLLAILFMTLCYVFVLSTLQPRRFSNTVLCYCAGMFYSYFKSDIDEVLKKYNVLYYVLFAVIIAIYLYLYPMMYRHIIIHNFLSISFNLIIVFASMKISFQSKIFDWCGQHLFWIYILQRLPMKLLVYWNVNEISPLIFVLTSFVTTVLMANYIKIMMDKFKNSIIA